eukprot:scaffold5811_cov62-Isochrysis_galbana.AAC.1
MDPLPLSLQQMQEGAEKRPVVLAVSPDLEPMRQSPPEYGLVALSGALAGLTTVGCAAKTKRPQQQKGRNNKKAPMRQGLPVKGPVSL